MLQVSSEQTLMYLLCLCLTEPGFSETHPLQRPTGWEALEHNTLNVPPKGAMHGPGGCKSLHTGDAIPRSAPDKGKNQDRPRVFTREIPHSSAQACGHDTLPELRPVL